MAKSLSTPGQDPIEDLSASMAGMSRLNVRVLERLTATPMPQCPPPPPSSDTEEDVKTPIQDQGIKINQFSIEKLTKDNTRYWFYKMETELRGQFSWQAIEYYQEVGEK